MSLTRLNHTHIGIPKGAEDQARAFYCDLLGLVEIPKPVELQHQGGLWLQLGDLQLHLGIENEDYRTRSRAHLAYQVDDLAEVRAKIEQFGLPIEPDTIQFMDFVRFQCRDPFGNRMEFIQPL